jgi:hypothetical protein
LLGGTEDKKQKAVRMASTLAETQTESFPNMNQITAKSKISFG